MNESDIHVIYGSRDIASMAYELMDAMDVAAELQKDTRRDCEKILSQKILLHFFHSKNRHGEIPCKTSVSRVDRIFPDYKIGCRKISCGSLFRSEIIGFSIFCRRIGTRLPLILDPHVALEFHQKLYRKLLPVLENVQCIVSQRLGKSFLR